MKTRIGIRIDRLIKLREERGWSQRELARRCDLSDSMVQKYETAASDPTSYTIILLAGTLDVSTDYLLGVTDDPRRNVSDGALDQVERFLVETYRHKGWSGIAHLGVEELSKFAPDAQRRTGKRSD